MRRLEETLRQMVQAAKAIGNTELENKFNEGRLLAMMDITGVLKTFYIFIIEFKCLRYNKTWNK